MGKSKSTVIALIALVVVCAGSFLGVKALNNRTQPSAPVVTTQQAFTTAPATTTAAQTTAEQTTAAQTTTEQTTAAQTTAAQTGESSPDALSTTASPFTTFAESSTAPTLSTTRPATTLVPNTTQTTKITSTTKASAESPSEVIKQASLFSDGFLGYKYDANGDVYYTNSDPWQRNFGFNELYDVGAAFIVFYYDTFRCKFNYANKDWMIQFWKGQYGFVFIGAEIGIYNKPESRKVEHYDCASDEDAIKMSMTCYRKGKEIFSRKYMSYWWCTGFVPGKLEKFSDRSELSLKARLTMKDYKMLIGFCGALKENGFELGKNYTTSGLDVFVSW